MQYIHISIYIYIHIYRYVSYYVMKQYDAWFWVCSLKAFGFRCRWSGNRSLYKVLECGKPPLPLFQSWRRDAQQQLAKTGVYFTDRFDRLHSPCACPWTLTLGVDGGSPMLTTSRMSVYSKDTGILHFQTVPRNRHWPSEPGKTTRVGGKLSQVWSLYHSISRYPYVSLSPYPSIPLFRTLLKYLFSGILVLGTFRSFS